MEQEPEGAEVWMEGAYADELGHGDIEAGNTSLKASAETDSDDDDDDDYADTVDEAVHVIIGRELLSMGLKLGHVVLPLPFGNHRRVLRDWDLYGPLMLCLILALVLTIESPPDDGALVFSGVFLLVWIGSAVVAANTLFLGGSVSIFQSLCVLGYCLAPIDLGAVIVYFLRIALDDWDYLVLLEFPIVVGLGVWASAASIGFISSLMPRRRKSRIPLALFPVVLFYGTISWLVLMMRGT